MNSEAHEDIGWPTPEEEAAQDRALDKSQAAAQAITPEELAELDATIARMKAEQSRDQSQPIN